MAGIPEILLLDDSREDRDLFALALANSGVRAILRHAEDVADAVLQLTRVGAYAHSKLPAVVVLDLALPKLDGIALLRLIRRDIIPNHIPVVILTGSLSESDRAVCESLGVDDFQVKPAQFAALVAFAGSLRRFLPGGACAADETARLYRRMHPGEPPPPPDPGAAAAGTPPR
jgi:DNA-binding response OmpR family regulator